MPRDLSTITVADQKRANRAREEMEEASKWFEERRPDFIACHPGKWVAYGISPTYGPVVAVHETLARAVTRLRRDYGVKDPLIERMPDSSNGNVCQDCGYRRVEYPCQICDAESKLKAAVAAAAKARALRSKLKTLKAERRITK